MMRYQNSFVAVVALVLSLITLTGTAYTDRFPQVARAESVGFDALAHELFDGGGDKQQVAETSKQ